MKAIKFFLIIIISLIISVKAYSNEELIKKIKQGGKIIFIRHAYAPGNGDPLNFNINDCSTQRNLNEDGVTLGLENSMSLAAIAKARHIGSLRIIDEDEYWDSKKDFDEVDFEDSTHLNHSNFKNASSVYLLDAFYSSSSKGGEADVRLSTEQVVALAEDAIQSFGMLPAPARAVFLEFFTDHNENNRTSIFGQTYQGPKGTAPTSFMNHFLIIDHTLRASGS